MTNCPESVQPNSPTTARSASSPTNPMAKNNGKMLKFSPYKGKRKALLITLLDPENIELNDTELCKKAGISRTLLYKYNAEPDFQRAVIDCTMRLYARHLPQTANRVIKDAKRGDNRAARIIHEALRLAGNNAQTVNVNVDASGQVEARTPAELLQYYEGLLADVSMEAQRIRAQIGIEQGVNRLSLPASTDTSGSDPHAIHPSDSDEDGGVDE